ncbi:short chain enoyl-CoA hydratase [Thermomonospora echinospora]|uniref:Short chain enoyl-CoA hydratase n=1 Tax=Thermomonospora echinospora TaxID=1992 RepID=A0A1H6AHE1_9ACTN|nr:enoyl-CoA hydratase/isomerase family protein [Thermomonospora echinospora]SEG48183.1 short chain enoyl-CoA hydratase [Thermomonospora echinospora]
MTGSESGIAWVRIEGSGPHNLLDVGALSALTRKLAPFLDAPPAAVMLHGGESFSAGADLTELGRMTAEEFAGLLDAELDLYELVERLPCPTVAVIRKWCQGSAAELALACDMRIAGESARFCLPEVAAGFPAPVHRLAQLVLPGVATELVLTGRRMGAGEAAKAGLYTQVVPDAELDAAARRLAERLAGLPSPAAVATTKAWLRQARAGEPFDRADLRARATSIFSDWLDGRR